MTAADLRATFAQETISDPFSTLRHLCALAGSEPDEVRALDRDDAFEGQRDILNSLVRQVGLFPYLTPGELSLSDQIAYELHRPEN